MLSNGKTCLQWLVHITFTMHFMCALIVSYKVFHLLHSESYKKTCNMNYPHNHFWAVEAQGQAESWSCSVFLVLLTDCWFYTKQQSLVLHRLISNFYWQGPKMWRHKHTWWNDYSFNWFHKGSGHVPIAESFLPH